MENNSNSVPEVLHSSSLYSKDLAPTPASEKTWNKWNLAALWVGMAVCIPTYLLASYMIRSGLSWQAALIIIGLANLVITIPMVLNGHAGVKYGIPFPVLGRAAFGTKGIHIPSFVRAIVACGWFGIQTWIGGLALYSIWNAITGQEGTIGLDTGKFIGFIVFWFINIYFIWKGTDSIRWLEDISAPILIAIGIILIYWGYDSSGGFGKVLDQGKQLQHPSAVLSQSANGNTLTLKLNPVKDFDGKPKASEYSVLVPTDRGNYDFGWKVLNGESTSFDIEMVPGLEVENILNGDQSVKLQFRNEKQEVSTILNVSAQKPVSASSQWWEYILWFTAMVGFWATMSISISDITRFAKSQKDQIAGQFIGLPGTMIFYSFVGIFVTIAAVMTFSDVMIVEDAPWDPVSLVAKFKTPWVVIFAQVAMIIATLSTNIAANVIAPANAFSNLYPKKISFRAGGIITGLIGIVICPWWLMNEISGILIFISGLLGPVVGILLCDYFLLRKKRLNLAELYKADGLYSYGGGGYHKAGMLALFAGVLIALIGYWIPSLDYLYKLSWFSGFIVSFFVYYISAKRTTKMNELLLI